jgi:hypothetical protein
MGEMGYPTLFLYRKKMKEIRAKYANTCPEKAWEMRAAAGSFADGAPRGPFP